jgi:hypothetical protein
MQHDEEIPGAMGTIIPAIALTALVIIGCAHRVIPSIDSGLISSTDSGWILSSRSEMIPSTCSGPFRSGHVDFGD